MKEHFRNTSPEANQAEAIKQAIEGACRTKANIVVGKEIPSFVGGTNIFMGIGLISGSNRIADGLGLGFINMACLAREVQKRIFQQQMMSKIFVLVADQHALTQIQSDSEKEKILVLGNKMTLVVQRIFQFLQCPDESVEVIKASAPEWPMAPTSDYVQQEISDILRVHLDLECGIKIGWQTKRKRKSGVPIRDEYWFDHQALAQHPQQLADMAFIQAPEWFSLKTHQPSNQNLPLPPYFGEEGFALGEAINLNALQEEDILTRQISRAIATLSKSIKKTLGVSEPISSRVFLQGLIDACVLERESI